MGNDKQRESNQKGKEENQMRIGRGRRTLFSEASNEKISTANISGANTGIRRIRGDKYVH
jgi:hypothetical protein